MVCFNGLMWGSRGVGKNLVIRLALSFVKNYSDFLFFKRLKIKKLQLKIRIRKCSLFLSLNGRI
jgi:predicted AAA+ superfamily ATPase